MGISEEELKAVVRRVLLRTLGPEGITDEPAHSQRAPAEQTPRPVVAESDVLAVPVGGTLQVAAGSMITPLARDVARDRRVALVDDSPDAGPSRQSAVASGPAQGRKVAIGADHGGYPLKEELTSFLGELGYAVTDCGTHSPTAVDYPDFAYAVARLVADGRAWRGIVVDGAGIGSCMVANKVPGVRAALCYDHASAVNSREHNDANVLTLGGLLIGRALARQIVQVWLETDFGGGRHGRRVDKIMAIEERFLRK
jgi:ribose 5-phosphate isomerase B